MTKRRKAEARKALANVADGSQAALCGVDHQRRAVTLTMPDGGTLYLSGPQADNAIAKLIGARVRLASLGA